jgi:hypothetical protein
MKRNEALITELLKEVMNATPKDQAVAIGNIRAAVNMLAVVHHLYSLGTKAFLEFLSVNTLKIVLRDALSVHVSEKLDVVEEIPSEVVFLKDLAALPKFKIAWKEVLIDKPTGMYRFLPNEALLMALTDRLSYINAPMSYREIVPIIERGTRSRDKGFFNDPDDGTQETVEHEIEVYEVLLKKVGREIHRKWFAEFIKVITCEQKFNLFCGGNLTDNQLQNLFCIYTVLDGTTEIADAIHASSLSMFVSIAAKKEEQKSSSG